MAFDLKGFELSKDCWIHSDVILVSFIRLVILYVEYSKKIHISLRLLVCWNWGQVSLMVWLHLVQFHQKWWYKRLLHPRSDPNTAAIARLPTLLWRSLGMLFFVQAVLSQLWGHWGAYVPGTSAEEAVFKSPPPLITSCLNCGVTQGRVWRLASEKRLPCSLLELTWSLFLSGNEMY